jgi:peptide methionine sulfoxide reductase MsrA
MMTAESVMKNHRRGSDKPLVTQLAAFDAFYKAENYHQRYYENNPEQGYCRVVIEPKVRKFRGKFKELLIGR